MEKKVIVELLSNTKENEKKMSVSEAENRAVVQTGNMYGTMKVQAEAIIETIQSIKMRLKVLEAEMQMTNTQ